MTRLVVRGPPPLISRDHDAPLTTKLDLRQRVGEITQPDTAAVPASREQRRLVDQILQVRANHARRGRGHNVQIDIDVERDRPHVHVKDRAPPGHVRRVDHQAAVETSRAKTIGS